jgi:hypothetical protein
MQYSCLALIFRALFLGFLDELWFTYYKLLQEEDINECIVLVNAEDRIKANVNDPDLKLGEPPNQLSEENTSLNNGSKSG